MWRCTLAVAVAVVVATCGWCGRAVHAFPPLVWLQLFCDAANATLFWSCICIFFTNTFCLVVVPSVVSSAVVDLLTGAYCLRPNFITTRSKTTNLVGKGSRSTPGNRRPSLRREFCKPWRRPMSVSLAASDSRRAMAEEEEEMEATHIALPETARRPRSNDPRRPCERKKRSRRLPRQSTKSC